VSAEAEEPPLLEAVTRKRQSQRNIPCQCVLLHFSYPQLDVLVVCYYMSVPNVASVGYTVFDTFDYGYQ
jgi:hypothetical protein